MKRIAVALGVCAFAGCELHVRSNPTSESVNATASGWKVSNVDPLPSITYPARIIEGPDGRQFLVIDNVGIAECTPRAEKVEAAR